MQIPVGYGQITVHYTGSAVPLGAVNVFGIQNVVDKSAAQITSNVLDAWDPFMANLPDEIQVSQISYKLGPSDDGLSFDRPVTLPGELTSAQGASPNVAFLLKKGTALGGRRNRGRLYLPGVTEGAVDQGGFLTGSWAADLSVAGASVLSQLGGDDIPMVVLHDGPGTPTQVQTLLCDARVATQRNRLRR